MTAKQPTVASAVWQESCQVYVSKGTYALGNRDTARYTFSSPDKADEVYAKVAALIKQELDNDH